MQVRSLVAVSLLALLLTGCSSYATTTPTATSSITIPTNSVQVTETANNTTVNLSVGQTLAITLNSNQTTGYSWNLVTAPTSTVLEKVSTTYEASPAKSGIVGSGGAETWQFKGLKTGTTTLKLVYAHSWEVEKSTSQEFSLTIIVK